MTRITALLAAILAIALIAGCAAGYKFTKSADSLNITLTADRYPLMKADNKFSVKVTDASGKAIRDAAVTVRYFMPSKAGTAPMEYIAQAAPKGDGYVLMAEIPREGGWRVEVAVAQPGKQPAIAQFDLDAR